jgi:hypothetical protein
MAVGAKRAAGRVIVERVIIGDLAVAADATVVVKLSAAALINNSMHFVFIGQIHLSDDWTPRAQQRLLIKTIARVTRSLLRLRPATKRCGALLEPRPLL